MERSAYWSGRWLAKSINEHHGESLKRRASLVYVQYRQFGHQLRGILSSKLMDKMRRTTIAEVWAVAIAHGLEGQYFIVHESGALTEIVAGPFRSSREAEEILQSYFPPQDGFKQAS